MTSQTSDVGPGYGPTGSDVGAPVPRAQDWVKSAASAAATSKEFAGKTMSALISASQWFDDLTAGKRGKVLAVLILVVATSQVITFWKKTVAFEIPATLLLLAALTAYTIARAMAFVDDWDNFRLWTAIKNVWAYVKTYLSRDTGDEDSDDEENVEVEQKRAKTLLKVALGLIALRSVLALLLWPLRLLDDPPLRPVEEASVFAALFGWLFLFVGAFTWIRLWFAGVFRGDSGLPAGTLAPARADVALADAAALPPALDMVRRKSEIASIAAGVRDPVLSKLLTTLPRWRPGLRKYESEYHALLERFLQRHFKGHDINSKSSVKIFTGGARRRVPDFVIDDAIVIELKPRLHHSGPAQRAIGQVIEYSEAFKHGPVFLLVCETDAQFETSYVVHALARQTTNRPTVIAAGPARPR